jgi:hypothetical protein
VTIYKNDLVFYLLEVLFEGGNIIFCQKIFEYVTTALICNSKHPLSLFGKKDYDSNFFRGAKLREV